MRLRGILLDKDGTFVDFQRTWAPAVAAVMRRFAQGDADVLGRLAEAMHYDLGKERILPTSPFIGGAVVDTVQAWGAILDETDITALVHRVQDGLRRESESTLTAIGDPLRTCTTLKENGLRLGVATNDGEDNARAQVARLGLDRCFEFIAGFDSGYGIKPGPGMVEAFARAIDVAPDAVALVGDTTHDLKAARAAGAVAVAVLSGPAARDELEPLADAVLPSIDALPAWVRSRNRAADPPA